MKANTKTPKHYDLAISPEQYAEENGLSFSEGNVVKYISRHRKKNGAEDVEKAMHYCEKILLRRYGINKRLDDVKTFMEYLVEKANDGNTIDDVIDELEKKINNG